MRTLFFGLIISFKVFAQDDASVDLAPPVDEAAPPVSESAPIADEDVYSAGESSKVDEKKKEEKKPKKAKKVKAEKPVEEAKTTDEEPKAASEQPANSAADVEKAAEKAAEPAASSAPQSAPQAENPSGAAAPQNSQTQPAVATQLSDGSRLNLAEKGFSIVPPKGWEIVRDQTGLSLLLQIPKSPDLKYQRNIQVNVFPNPQYIDSFTAQEVEDRIVKNFSMVGGVADYKIRNHSEAKFADGRVAHLVYTEFKLNNLNMMQALLIATTASRHYLLSFTDVAEHFEASGQNQSPILNEAWTAMTSLELDGPTPSRFDMIMMIGGSIGLILILALVIGFVRRMRAARLYRNFDGIGDGIDKDPVSGVQSNLKSGFGSRFESDIASKRGAQDATDKVHTSSISHFSEIQSDVQSKIESQDADLPISSLSKYDSILSPKSAAPKKEVPAPPKPKK